MKVRARGDDAFACAVLLGLATLVVGCEAERPDAAAPAARTQSVTEAAAPASPRVVLGRLGDPGLRPAGMPRLRRLRIDRESRPGVCSAVPFAFELVPPSGSERLSFAFTARSRAEEGKGSEAPAAFDVRLERAGVTLIERRATRADHWQSAVLDLPDPSNAPLPLRFVVDAAIPGAEFCFGSVDFLGGRARLDQAPHVLLVSLDTLGAPYLASHGGMAGISPRIDRFLSGSFEFRRAMAQFGHTLVSHSSLFSAQYPRVHGRYSNRWERGLPALDSLIETVAKAGYRTAAFTENAYVSSQFGFDRGFDVYHDGDEGVVPGRGQATQTFERGQEFLRDQAGQVRLFLFLHTYEVHSPYVPKTEAGMKLANRLTPGDTRLFTNEQTHDAFTRHMRGEALLSKREQRRLLALHHAEILELDGAFGALIDTISKLGLEREMLVVVTSDHGEVFGENGAYAHGITLHNRILNVPLAFRWPGRIEPGSSEVPVQLIDGLVSVLDLLGLELSAPGSGRGRDGRSLVPRMMGEAVDDDAAIAISEEFRPRPHCRPRDTDPACWVEHYSVQSRRFKLVRSRDGRYERFYDLEHDPNEISNAVGTHDEEARRALEHHRAALDQYLATTPEVPLHAQHEPEAQPPEDERDAEAGGEVDAETRARLEALGYVF